MAQYEVVVEVCGSTASEVGVVAPTEAVARGIMTQDSSVMTGLYVWVLLAVRVM